jgi:phage tail sheath gpL-like
MTATFVATPRVTLNIVTRPQTIGLEDQRALLVGQISNGVRAKGTITFATQPLASATITLNGTAVTFVASGATGNQVNIGANLAATLAALVTFLNASADVQISKCFYYATATVLYVVNKTFGTSGNTFTLAASVATVSGATLAGGAAYAGTAVAGTLVTDVGRTDAEINDLFGADSHLALIARAYRQINPYTNLDALPLADNAAGVKATAKLTVAGTATRSGTIYVKVISAEKHTYQVDVNIGDTAVQFLANLAAAIAADTYLPFFYYDDQQGVATWQALNAGLAANDWLIAYEGAIPGMTFTLTAWTGGATDPSLTTLFDPVANLRYQTVVWPQNYSTATLKAFLDVRKNVDNDIKEGRAFLWSNKSFATVKSDATTLNSSEIVILTNEPTVDAKYKGPHLPEDPTVLAAKFAAARDRRFETNVSISDIVATFENNDQFGGPSKASLPYFNTPLLGVGLPLRGSGYSYAEQLELERNGVSVAGVNRSGNGIVTGPVVTTWLDDVAGNPDNTWKYLEWRDTHGVVREYLVLNIRKRFAQYRMTLGDTVANFAIVNEQMIRGYILGLLADLMEEALVVKGQESRQYIQDNMVVTLNPETRTANVLVRYPQVSQLENVIGSVQYTWTMK